MDSIVLFLADPIVSLVGYIFSLAASLVAVAQFFEKTKAKNEVRILKVEIANLQATVSNKNRVTQGNKSQYFQDNSGPVNIDNRG